ncbi:MAG TPA: ABC transporter substrate-binding protein [Chloroflexia bacterium]|nr:ABC transporter substrate-binding protein [Chloroflexia bacterium]
MDHLRRQLQGLIGVGSLALVLALGAGCDYGTPPTATSVAATPSPVAAAAAAVTAVVEGAHPHSVPPPAQLVQPGRLTVGSDASYPPMEYLNPQGAIVGMDIDLIGEVANRLGLDLALVNFNFDNIFPALNKQTFDLVISSVSITPERQQIVDFVPYYDTGRAIQVTKGNPKGIHKLEDLAGKIAAVQQGTAEERIVSALNDRLAAAGQPKVTVRSFGTDTEAVQQLRAGQVDAVLHQFVVAAYYTKQDPTAFEVAVPNFEAVRIGIAIAKSNPAMQAPISTAIQQMQVDGTLSTIETRWGLK